MVKEINRDIDVAQRLLGQVEQIFERRKWFVAGSPREMARHLESYRPKQKWHRDMAGYAKDRLGVAK